MNIISEYSFPIYEQNSLLYYIDFELDNLNTICHFGFENSGSNQGINFLISGNELFDKDNDSVLVIEQDKKISISGNIKEEFYTIKNRTLLNLEKPKSLININNFYLNTSHEIKNFNLKLNGELFPVTDVKFLNNPYTTGEHITGIFINSGQKDVILNDIQVGGYYLITGQILDQIIAPGQTGKFLILTSGLNLEKDSEVTVNIYGNFGIKNHKEIIYGVEENLNIFNIEPYKIEDVNALEFNGEGYEKYKILLDRRDVNSFESIKRKKNIKISFEYSSGATGDLSIEAIPGTGFNTVNFSGNITGSGSLQNNKDVFLTGYNFISEAFVSGFSNETKNYVSPIYYLSGNFDQDINVTGSGFVFGGYLTKNDFLVTGETQIINLSGYVKEYDIIFNTGINFIGIGDDGFGNLQSGYVKDYEVSTGSYFIGISNQKIANINATGIVSGLAKGVAFNNFGYASGIVSGYITGSGYLRSENINYFATGFLSGDLSRREIVKNINRPIYSSLSFVTGNLSYELKDFGTGLATGDYKNTNITGNATLATGIRQFLATGIALSGSGVLRGIGYGVLSNSYGEEELIIYTGAKTFYATGNPNSLGDPINSQSFSYEITGTGRAVYVLQNGLKYRKNPQDLDTFDQFTGSLNNIKFTGAIDYQNNQDAMFPSKIIMLESGINNQNYSQQAINYFSSSDQTNPVFNYPYSDYVTGSGIISRPFKETIYFTGINYNAKISNRIANVDIYSDCVGDYKHSGEILPSNLNFTQSFRFSGWSPDPSKVTKTYLPEGLGNSCAMSDDGKIKVFGWPSANNRAGVVFSTKNNLNNFQILSGTHRPEIPLGKLNNLFGHSLALNARGDILAIGAPGEKIYNLTGMGAVYVYTGDSQEDSNNYWKFSQKILLPDLGINSSENNSYDFFGASLSFNDDGNILIIGRPNAHLNNVEDVGSVYVYEKTNNSNTYYQTREILYPTGAATIMNNNLAQYSEMGRNRFGASLAINGNGNRLIISAPNDYSRIEYQEPEIGNRYVFGWIYFYEKQNQEWVLIQKIPADKTDSYYWPTASYSGPKDFGVTIDRSGNNIAFIRKKLLSLNANPSPGQSMQIWENEALILKHDGAQFIPFASFRLPEDNFLSPNELPWRNACKINKLGNTVVIGVPYSGVSSPPQDQTDGQKKGEIYIYKKTGDNAWNFLRKFNSNPISRAYEIAANIDFFGTSVDISASGENILVGAPFGYYGGVFNVLIDPSILQATGNFSQTFEQIIYDEADAGVKNLNEYNSSFSTEFTAYVDENLNNITGLIKTNTRPLASLHSFTDFRFMPLGSYILSGLKEKNLFESGLFTQIKNNSPKIKRIFGNYNDIRLKGTGFMTKDYSVYNYTGNFQNMSGLLPVYGNQIGVHSINEFTGYKKDIDEVVYGNLQNPISLFTRSPINSSDLILSSGNLKETIYRTGYFQQIVEDLVSGSFYSQKEFTYTGELSKYIDVDITSPLGYVQTGFVLEKNKDLIDLNNYSYQGNVINLTPITNLYKSGQYLLLATGYKEEIATGIVTSSILIDETGVFECTGSIDFDKNYYFDESSQGRRRIVDTATGFFNNPKILNNSGYIEGQYTATGTFDRVCIGSGMLIKSIQITPESFIPSGEFLTGFHLDYRALETNLSVNVVSGIFNYNNTLTKIIDNNTYTGYLSTGLATGFLSKEESYLETGIIINSNNTFRRKFTDFFNIKTGYYNINGIATGMTDFKNNNFIINDNFYDSKEMASDIEYIYIQIDKTKDYNNDTIVGKLSVSGDTEELSRNIYTYISGKGGLN